MTIESILEAEMHVSDSVTLYYEGMFWKAYERSAYIICTQVRPFKTTRRFIKKMGGREVVSIGFPDTSLDSLMKGRPIIRETPLSRSFGGFREVSEQDFIQWKNPGTTDIKEVPDDGIQEVIRRLREFDMLNHTPYDCLLLVGELKRLLV